MPRSPQEQMAMTPEVFKFTRNFGRGAPTRQEPSVIQQVAGDLGKLALLGAVGGTAHGLGQILSTENNISPVSEAVMSAVGKPEEKFTYTKDYSGNKSGNYGNPPKKESPSYKGMTRTQVVPEDDRNYGNQEIPVKDPRSNRFESIRQQEEDRAELDYIMSGGAALDQAFEDAVARDDYHEERFGLPGSPQSSAIVEGPETVIQPANEPKGFLDAFSQEVKDFDHNIP